MFEDLDFLMDKVVRVSSFGSKVQQLHGDQAPGLEVARCEHFAGATRVSDFSHVLGLVRRDKSQNARGSQEEAWRTWRAGLLATVKKASKREVHAELVKEMVHATRVLMFPIFSYMWQVTLTYLEGADETELVRILKKYYLAELDVDGQAMFSATWRGSPDYLQPGSNVGSQPQDIVLLHVGVAFATICNTLGRIPCCWPVWF